MMKHYSAVMKKSSNGRSRQHESENAGCISSIFRMFEFRRSHKLISYLNYTDKHVVVDVNAKSKTNGGLHECVDNVNKNTRGAHPSMQSVKTLMEEEMAKLIPESMVTSKSCQNKISDEKNQVKLEKKLNQEIVRPNRPMFPQSPESFDFTNQTDCYDLDSCLSEFSSRESYPKKFAKSICNSRDSNSIIQCLGGLDQSDERNRNNSFREMEKSKNNQGYSRIVILKPSLSRINSPLDGIDNERGLHHFSLTEIKNRLRKTITESRKERDLISIEPDVSYNASKVDPVEETVESKTNSTGEEAERTMESFSYEMAKMHLIQRVDRIGKNDFKIVREKKTLSSLFSLPDFDSLSSPICTPRKEDDADLLAENSTLTCLEPLEEDYNGGILNRLVGYQRTEDGFKVTPQEVGTHGDDTQARESVDHVESVDLLEIGNTEKAESLQLSEKGNTSNSDERSIDELVQSTRPEVFESTDTSEEKIEDSCPASLHDEFVQDDIVKFTSRATKHEELLPIQRTIIRLKEFDISSFLNPTYETPILDDKEIQYEFVSVVVNASGLCRAVSERWRADDPLLDSFLYDEIGISYDYSDDSKYLFDLIEEVLNEIRNKFFVTSPWVWSIHKIVQSVPVGEDLIQEVCKGIDLHLKHKFPCTLDQIVGKDMEYRSWMDTRPDIEIIVLEIGDDILDDLLEEAVFDLWFL